jgi:hypothetical protein
MATEIVVGFASDMMEHVDVEADISSCYNVVNGYEPSSLSLISSTGSTEEQADDAVEYYQCPENNGEAFFECQVCGSFDEPGTYWQGCHNGRFWMKITVPTSARVHIYPADAVFTVRGRSKNRIRADAEAKKIFFFFFWVVVAVLKREKRISVFNPKIPKIPQLP